MAAELQSKLGGTIVLKGANTVVLDERNFYINQTGNPGMATAGSGDCLAGIIGSLLGQKFVRKSFELTKPAISYSLNSAALGVYLHGISGDLASKELGEYSLNSLDIINRIPKAIISHGGR